MTKKENDSHPKARPYPNPIFENYDYTSDVEGDETSPGGGLFHGPMSRFKSVDEFLKEKRKANEKIRKAYLSVVNMLQKKSSQDEKLEAHWANKGYDLYWLQRGEYDAARDRSPLITRTRNGYRFDIEPPSYWTAEEEERIAKSYTKGYDDYIPLPAQIKDIDDDLERAEQTEKYIACLNKK